MIGGFLWVTEDADLQRCLALRKEVFMDEQGFSYDQDETDKIAHHLLFLDDELPIGALRLYKEESCWHVGRICVKQRYRGTGVGKFLLEECIFKAKELHGPTRLILGAQAQAIGFYEKLGFTPYGEPYEEEGCPHQMMQYNLCL